MYKILLFLIPTLLFSYPGERLIRKGDEIQVAGQLFHTETHVILFSDPGGFDGYRVERRFSSIEKADWANSTKENKQLTSPNRYGMRLDSLSKEETERVRGGGWDLPLLKRTIDQLVLHYDNCGLSTQCFRFLHDARGLSIHFMIDLDGTIYQTLDVKERAWHATQANSRSIGIEIANVGAFASNDLSLIQKWYQKDSSGKTSITIPKEFGNGNLRTPNYTPVPARNPIIKGEIHGKTYHMYDLTKEQYDALIKLSAALCNIFPKIKPTYPRNHQGKLLTQTLSPSQFATYQGILGHYHIQKNKIDPGPALQWDTLITGIKKHLRPKG